VASLIAATALAAFAVAQASADDPPKSPSPDGGTVTGVVVYRGTVPAMSIADAAGVRRPLLTVDRRTRGLRDAVVWLTRQDDSEPIAELAVAPPGEEPAVIDQKDYEFTPRVMAIREGRPVKFTNSDPANHNVRSVAVEPKNQFNVLTGAAGQHIHHFQAPRATRPIRLGCDIHGWMRAWIYVFKHERFAVTDRKGKFQIDQIPPGRYTLHVRQPDGGLRTEREIEVQSKAAEPLEIEFTEADLKPVP
jgi:plastocyanin